MQKSDNKSEVGLTVCLFELSWGAFYAVVSKHSTTTNRLHHSGSKSIRAIAIQHTQRSNDLCKWIHSSTNSENPRAVILFPHLPIRQWSFLKLQEVEASHARLLFHFVPNPRNGYMCAIKAIITYIMVALSDIKQEPFPFITRMSWF